MCRCIDATDLRFDNCKLYSLFHLDYHSTGAFIQNKDIKDNCRRQKGRFYRRERRNYRDCGGFEACFVFAYKFKPSLYFRPCNIACTVRCLVLERWSVDGGVSLRREGLGTARGVYSALSLVIYVTISPYYLSLKRRKKEKVPFLLRAIMTVKTEAFLTPQNPPPMEFSALLLSCWPCRSEVCSVMARNQTVSL